MRHLIPLLSLLLLMFTTPLSAQSYKDLWAKVEASQDKDLPRDVIRDAQKIYDKAHKEHNFPQLAKAWITLFETQAGIDPDSFNIAQVKPLPHQGVAQTAIYHAILATAYQAMTYSHIYQHNADTVQAFNLRAHELFTSALSHPEELAQTSAQDYLPIVTLGDDSRLYGHDLLSLLIRYTSDQGAWTEDEKARITSDAADVYLRLGNRNGWALMTLQKLRAQNQHPDYKLRLKQPDYLEALRQLVDQTQDLEAGADVGLTYVHELSLNDEKIDFIHWAYQHYGQSPLINSFKNLERDILSVEAQVYTPGHLLPGRPFDLSISYRNATRVNIEVRQYNGERNYRPRTDGALVLKRQYTLGDDPESQSRRSHGYPVKGEHTDQLTLPAGHYVLISTVNGESQKVDDFHVFALQMAIFRLPGNQCLVQVRDIRTGRPVPNAHLELTNVAHQRPLTTDPNGEVIISDLNRFDIVASIPGTHEVSDRLSFSAYSYTPREGSPTHCNLFTDRAIYRPGQTLHLSGIIYSQQGDDTQVVARHFDTATLYDANHRKVQEQKLVTNELGSFSLDFTLPQEGLPGDYSLQVMGQSTHFRVEEYKRPTFTTEAKVIGHEGRGFSFGDTLQVEASARTYAGVPVQEARVHYTISTRRTSFLRWMAQAWEVIDEGDTLSDDQGKVCVPLFLDPKKLTDADRFSEYNRVEFQVEATFTDQAGETHEADYSVSLARQGFGLHIQAPSCCDLANAPDFTVQALNANGDKVAVQGTYIIYNEQEENPLLQGTFSANAAMPLPSLRPGSYHLVAKATDQNGLEISTRTVIYLYDSRQATELLMPRPTLSAREVSRDVTLFRSDFVHAPVREVSEQQPAELFFAPAQGDVHVSYLVLSDHEVISRGSFELGHALYRLTIPYQSTYGNGFKVYIYYVREGEVCNQTVQFTYQRPDKRLQLTWKTFRDRLQPGQQEQWILNIHRPDGAPVQGAELLATLYDASLDQIYSDPWSFSLSFNRRLISYSHYLSDIDDDPTAFLSLPTAHLNTYYRSFDELAHYIEIRYRNTKRMYTGAASNLVYSMAAPRMMTKGRPVEEEEDTLDEVMTLDNASVPSSQPSAESPTPSSSNALALPRHNFSETAFFLPHLLSDPQGDVHISFTLPESLTEWRFMGLAHDQAVNYGLISATTIAHRDFMVQPNMPRFVREGDKVTISTRLINQSEQPLSGTAQLQLIDPETDEVILTRSQPFALEANATSSASFSFEADDRYPMLICEVTAQSGTFGDGERHYLPVLSSRQYVTEAIPFYLLPGDSVKHIDVSSLFNEGSPTATHRQLILEYTAHPEWTLIEALDGIKLPTYDNAPALAASLFANVSARHIAQSIPGFEEAVREGLAQCQGQPQSQLQMNQELRDLILTQSPWLNDALQEADQRARLLDLFNEDLMQGRITKALKKLKQLQNHDGSWSWFEGMDGNYYITLSVAESLIDLSDDDPQIKAMVIKALEYLDTRTLKNYNDRRKHKSDKLYPTDSDLDYLYLTAKMPQRQVSSSVLTMRNTYLKHLPKMVRDLTILGRSQASCTLRAFGHPQEADDFLESVIQYSITKPGMGRYYVTDAAYYSWRDYRIPTHLAAMHAIRQSPRPDRAPLLADMKLWLLRQKQTQIWDTPLNTLSALTFFLTEVGTPAVPSSQPSAESPSPARSNALPTFTLDGQTLPTPLDTTRFLAPQLGYIRTTLPSSATSHPLHTLTLTQPSVHPVAQPASQPAVPSSQPSAESPAPSLSNAPDPSLSTASTPSPLSWGALYSRCLEDITRLPSRTTGELQVSIQLLVKSDPQSQSSQPSAESPSPVPLTTHVGARLTLRITLTADRDMDFLQLHIQRPACLEPLHQLSGYLWLSGRGGYIAQHDASTDLFFDRFTRGSFTYDIDFYVDRPGEYLTGITTAQCAYAPEFTARAAAQTLIVK